jgi:hypothetical protein
MLDEQLVQRESSASSFLVEKTKKGGTLLRACIPLQGRQTLGVSGPEK